MINPTTGEYVLTLLDNVLHTPGGNENNAQVSLAYSATMTGGGTVFGDLNITFDDDMPSTFTPAGREPVE